MKRERIFQIDHEEFHIRKNSIFLDLVQSRGETFRNVVLGFPNINGNAMAINEVKFV